MVGREVFGRDTDSKRAVRRGHVKANPVRARTESIRHSPEWDRIVGAWRCTRCARAADDADLKGKCGGFGPQVFAGWSFDPDGVHTLWSMGGWVWCTRCGGFARRVARLLSNGCRGKVTAGGRNALRWLKAAKSPYVPHEWLGEGRPRRLHDVPESVLSDAPVLGDLDRATALDDDCEPEGIVPDDGRCASGASDVA